MDDVRDMVAKASRILGNAGHGDLIWGHASSRDPDDRGVWIKQSTWGMEEITPERVHLVNGRGEVVEGDGPRHSEYPIHTEIMAARPDVGGVVHTHSRFALALAATGQELRAVSHEGNFFCPPGVPRFTDTADLIRTPELGKSVAEALGSAPAIFLVNHGIVCVGPERADRRRSRRSCWTGPASSSCSPSRAGGWPTWSPDAESLSKRQNIYPEPALYHVWDYLLRQFS